MTEATHTVREMRLVILRSDNGRDGWTPLLPSEVPDWVKHPDVMGELVAGNMAMDPTVGEAGTPWYRAERISETVTEQPPAPNSAVH